MDELFLISCCSGGCQEGGMGWQTGVPDGLHSYFRWIGKRMEIPVHRVRERRRCLSHTVYHSPDPGRETILFAGGTPGTVHQ